MTTFEAKTILRVDDQSNGAFRKMANQAQRMNATLATTAQRMQRVGAVMSAAVAAPIAAGFGVAISNAMGMQDVMIDIAKISGASTPEMEAYGKQVTTLANQFGLGRAEMGELALGFVSGGKSMQDAAVLAQLATKANIGLGLSIENLRDRLPTFQNVLGLSNAGLSANLDLINFYSDNTTAKADEIFAVQSQLAASAKSFGLEANQVTALSAATLAGGVDAGSSRAGIENLLVQLQDLGTTNRKDALKQLGLDAESMQRLQKENPEKFFLTLAEALGKVDNAAALANDLGGIQGGRVLIALASENSILKQSFADAAIPENFLGSVDVEVARRMGALSFSMDMLKNTFLNLVGTFADPFLVPLAEQVIELNGWIKELDGTLTDSDKVMTVYALGGVAAAFTGLLALGTAFNFTLWALAPLTTGLIAASTATWAFAASTVRATAGIVALRAAAIGATVTALIPYASAMWAAASATTAFTAIAAIGFAPLIIGAGLLALAVIGIATHWDELAQMFSDGFGGIFGGLGDVASAFGALLSGDFSGFVSGVADGLSSIGSGFLSLSLLIPTAIFRGLQEVAKFIYSMLPDSLQLAIESAFAKLVAFKDMVISIFANAFEAIRSAFAMVFDLLPDGLRAQIGLGPTEVSPFDSVTPPFLAAGQAGGGLNGGNVALDPNSKATVDVNVRIAGEGEVTGIETDSDGNMAPGNVGVQRLEFEGDF